MSGAEFLLKTVFIALTVKAALFWVYLWQLKEYRIDRFLAEYGSLSKYFRLWFFSGGRRFYTPVWTAKATAAFIFSLLPIFFIFLGEWWLVRHGEGNVTTSLYILVYLIIAPFAALVTYLLRIPTELVKRSIYNRAQEKIKKAQTRGLVVIGIAGSYGKSSTKEFVSQILSRKFQVVKTPRNVNTEIGVARFILDHVSVNDNVFVAEMGAYRAGEIANLARIVQHQVGILTGISEQHLALFGSFENIKKAKFELIESLPENGLAVFNADDKHVMQMAKRWRGKKILYHRNENLRRDFPPHYQINLSGAVEVAKFLGMTAKEIEKGIKHIRLTDIMIRTYTGKGGALVINDTYSSNPEGVRAALDYLCRQPHKRKIVVMPGIIELGERSEQIHSAIGRQIAEVCDKAFIINPDYFSAIRAGAGDKAVFVATPKEVIALLEKELNSDVAVLLEGRIPENVVTFLQ